MKFNFNNPEYELNFNLFIKKINTVCVLYVYNIHIQNSKDLCVICVMILNKNLTRAIINASTEKRFSDIFFIATVQSAHTIFTFILHKNNKKESPTFILFSRILMAKYCYLL